MVAAAAAFGTILKFTFDFHEVSRFRDQISKLPLLRGFQNKMFDLFEVRSVGSVLVDAYSFK